VDEEVPREVEDKNGELRWAAEENTGDARVGSPGRKMLHGGEVEDAPLQVGDE
jgi:hypothetical protein